MICLHQKCYVVLQIQEIQSTPWMSVTADDKENRLKISLAEKLVRFSELFYTICFFWKQLVRLDSVMITAKTICL